MDLVKTRRLSSPHRIEASLQSIDFSDYLLLAQLGSSDETSTAAKIDEEIVAAFKRLLVLLRVCGQYGGGEWGWKVCRRILLMCALKNPFLHRSSLIDRNVP